MNALFRQHELVRLRRIRCLSKLPRNGWRAVNGSNQRMCRIRYPSSLYTAQFAARNAIIANSKRKIEELRSIT